MMLPGYFLTERVPLLVKSYEQFFQSWHITSAFFIKKAGCDSCPTNRFAAGSWCTIAEYGPPVEFVAQVIKGGCQKATLFPVVGECGT